MPRKPTTETATVTVTPDTLKSRADRAYREALTTYRAAVASAASADGQLPADQLDDVVEACRVTGVPVEQFSDDVDNLRRHRQLADRVTTMEAEVESRQSLVESAVKDVARLEAELMDARNRIRLNGGWFFNQLSSTIHTRSELEERFPHLFGDAASVTPEIVKRKLTTRAFFVG
jgi:hypothetical protein